MSEENQTVSSSNTEENKNVSYVKESSRSSSGSLEEIRLRSLKSSEKEKSVSSKEKQKFTPNEVINEYYRLKNKYETTYYEKYVKPIVQNKKSKREKRVDFSRLPKHECINCKRNVGTIFNISQNEELIRKFIAKCGDLSDPCPLNIQIDYGFREQIDIIINSGLKQIENIKLQIIKEKNTALFFNGNVVDIFNILTENLKKEAENTGFLIETNILKNNNPEKQLLLKKTIDEFGKGYILQFKQMIIEFMEKNDELKLDEAVKFYINEMIPKLKEIQDAKYNISDVEYDEVYNEGGSIKSVYKLIQLPQSLENTEFSIESDDKVLSFIIGVNKSKKAKTMKINETSLKKTRKIKPTDDFEFVIEDEETDVAYPTLIRKESLEGLEGVPDFDVPGRVKWNNETYNKIWSRLPSNLKDILITDKDWLQEYVSRCVASKNEKNACRLFLPDNTIIPPNKIQDERRFDFGLEVLNHIFNKLDKQYSDTLLTWTEEKYAENNYASFREILVSLLERNLKLDKYTYGYGNN